LTEIYFGHPISASNPCRNEFRRTLSVTPFPPATHAEMNFGDFRHRSRACPLTEISFGHRPFAPATVDRNEFRRTLSVTPSPLRNLMPK
jgi:hypothetical protein